MTTTYDCVIMADGEFPTTEHPLSLLKDAQAIIACDGAICKLHEQGIRPDAVVGDLDSIPTEMRKIYADRLHQTKEQDTNDLTKSAMLARSLGYKSVLILGATGLREDHTLGNISLLARYMDWFDCVEILSDYGRFTPINKSCTLTSVAGQQVSIFAMDNQTRITTKGLRWDVTDRIFSTWWQGTLNEAANTEFSLTFPAGSKLIIYRAAAESK